mmetsp:Transcript_59579/g.141768  ORF Transcript_59579/g.141768 Transcript_59579/m.141768 type:complete len:383 (+) Transcript_59579:53-1201(+)
MDAPCLSAGLSSARQHRDGMYWQITNRQLQTGGSTSSLPTPPQRAESVRRQARRCSEPKTPKVDPASICSPAGARSARTVLLASHGVTSKGQATRAPARAFPVQEMPRRGRGASCPPPRSDPVAHREVGGLEESVSTRSLRKVGYQGISAVGNGLGSSSRESSARADEVRLSARVLAKDEKASRTTRGEVVWNVAGDQDLLPAGTKAYTKADTPVSFSHRRKNDQRQLMVFEWSPGGKGPNPQLKESPDLRHCPGFAMHGSSSTQEAETRSTSQRRAVETPGAPTPLSSRGGVAAPAAAPSSSGSTTASKPQRRQTPSTTAQESFPSRLPEAPAETVSLSSRRLTSGLDARRMSTGSAASSRAGTPRSMRGSEAMKQVLSCA